MYTRWPVHRADDLDEAVEKAVQRRALQRVGEGDVVALGSNRERQWRSSGNRVSGDGSTMSVESSGLLQRRVQRKDLAVRVGAAGEAGAGPGMPRRQAAPSESAAAAKSFRRARIPGPSWKICWTEGHFAMARKMRPFRVCQGEESRQDDRARGQECPPARASLKPPRSATTAWTATGRPAPRRTPRRNGRGSAGSRRARGGHSLLHERLDARHVRWLHPFDQELLQVALDLQPERERSCPGVMNAAPPSGIAGGNLDIVEDGHRVDGLRFWPDAAPAGIALLEDPGPPARPWKGCAAARSSCPFAAPGAGAESARAACPGRSPARRRVPGFFDAPGHLVHEVGTRRQQRDDAHVMLRTVA